MAAPRSNPRQSQTIAEPSTKSRQKAEHSKDTANAATETAEPVEVPRGADGRPLVRLLVTASEIVPTGQFANVAIGPMQATLWIDPNDPDPVTEEHLNNIAMAMNKVAEAIEGDVVAVQRDIVLANLAEQASSKS